MRRAIFGLAAVAVVALMVVGCGGSGDSGGSGDTWTTATMLSSSDPPGATGLLTSQPFTTSNRVQFVLDVPNGDALDGVSGSIVPADQAADSSSVLTAIKNGESVPVAVSKARNTKVVSGLNGTYVLIVTPPAIKEWSMEIQTAP
jgi:hypothetical protein